MNSHFRKNAVKPLLLLGIVTWLGMQLSSTRAEGGESPSLNPKLEPLRPLLGKTWKGQFKNSKPESPVVDILRCERALNGQAVRFMHSINKGVYGGETLFVVDPKTQKVVYYYFTTAGFMTTGAIEFEGPVMVSHERVEGNSGGVTEVRARSELKADGKLHVRSEHLKGGEWSPGHEVMYAVDPTAEVIFK